MPSFPNGPGNMRNNPILQPIVGNGGFQPPVQNPGMAMPGTEGPLLIGGSNPYPDNINIGYQPPVQNPGMPPMGEVLDLQFGIPECLCLLVMYLRTV